MAQRIVNLPASVRQRLLNLSRQRTESFSSILSRYVIERLLYRLSQSTFADQFVLKGAVLFTIWTGQPHRSTRDLDLLGYGTPEPEAIRLVFTELCRIDVQPDGLFFDPASISVREIRETQRYGGQRVQMMATLDTARISLQVDIGFGDAVTPSTTAIVYPSLLDFPSPHLHAYPRETVVAEKLETMVALGELNSRMKDFYDLWTLSRLFAFDGVFLSQAISATFHRRQNRLPDGIPIALTPEFGRHRDKITQWEAFLRKNRLNEGTTLLSHIIAALETFLLPPLLGLAGGRQFEKSWSPGGPWREGRLNGEADAAGG